MSLHRLTQRRLPLRRSAALLPLLAAGLLLPAAHAQEPAPPPPAAQQTEPQPAQPGQTFEPNAIRAWSLITDAAGPGRPAHDRVQAMAALSTLGNDQRAARLIEEGFTAKDSDVRVAAVLAAGQTKNPALLPALQRVLDDDNSQVAYTAALTLWKLHDTSGEDLLMAVALGDRKASPSLLKSQKHKAVKELHSPKTMAMIAVNQGSGYFLGPFGVGLKAIEMADKNSGAPLRAAAIDQLAQQHTPEVHDVLVQDLTDGEPAVRAAAAKGLGRWQDEDTIKQVLPMFGDNHLAVRLTAAATFLRVVNRIPTPQDSVCDFE